MPSTFPFPLDQYADPAGATLVEVLLSRLAAQPFNGVATGLFLLAVLHTFVANRFRRWAHHAQHEFDHRCREQGRTPHPSFKAELLHFLGEVEVVFGLWALAVMLAITLRFDWETARRYVTETLHYIEPMFVVVVMAIASPAVPGAAEAVKQSGRSDVKVTGLGLPNASRPYLKDGVLDSVVLWNTMDLGYLTIQAASALARGALRPGQAAFAAGRLGSLKVEGDNLLLGAPFTFTRDNVDRFDF